MPYIAEIPYFSTDFVTIYISIYKIYIKKQQILLEFLSFYQKVLAQEQIQKTKWILGMSNTK